MILVNRSLEVKSAELSASLSFIMLPSLSLVHNTYNKVA